MRLLGARDPGLEVRYVDPDGDEGPTLFAGGGRAVFVVVSLLEGVRLPEAWTRQTTPVFASAKPDGAAADAVYRACAAAPCPP